MSDTTENMTSKNFGLSQQEFNTMVEQLKSGDEALFEKIFLSQFSESLTFVKRKYNISHEDAYDACMDSLINFRTALLRDKVSYGNLRHLFTLMASQRYLKSRPKKQLTSLSPNEQLIIVDENKVSEEDLKILNRCWEKMGTECRHILKSFYYGGLKSNEIAESVGKTPAAVRKQKERCVTMLRSSFLQYTKA